jgi:hypothetical protein
VSFIGAFNDHVPAGPVKYAPLQTAATLRVLHEELLCSVVDEEQNQQRLQLLRDEEAQYADAVEALAVQAVQQQQEHDDFEFALQRREAKKSDYLRYIQYEYHLDALRKKLKKENVPDQEIESRVAAAKKLYDEQQRTTMLMKLGNYGKEALQTEFGEP